MNREILEDRVEAIKYLANELINNRLCIFLGSGISLNQKVPSWENLVKNVCLAAKFPYKAKESKLVSMKYCKTKLGDDYIDTVKEILYKDYNNDLFSLTNDRLLTSLSSLIIGAKRGRVSKVVTYNYDDILETYLHYFGYKPNIIHTVPYESFDSDVKIYHPHGYLPKLMGDNSPKIVLDQDSYAESSDIENPLYRELQTVITSRTALLIGTSGDDDNTNKLFLKCQKLYLPNPKILGFIFVLKPKNTQTLKDTFKEKGIITIEIANFDEIPEILVQISRQAMEYKYQDSI